MQKTHAISLHGGFATIMGNFLRNFAAITLVEQCPVGILGYPEAAVRIHGRSDARAGRIQWASGTNQLAAQEFNLGGSFSIHALSLCL
ncbi:hypothetical protein D3C78_1340110 [compost metagenome]